MRNKQITFCDYLAHKCPNEAYEVLMESGHSFENPRSKEELATVLKKYVAMDRNLALKKLAAIHPDKELIQSLDREVRDNDFQVRQADAMFGSQYENPFQKTPFRVGVPSQLVYQNASGCGCGSMNFNASGGCSCSGCKCSGCKGDKMNADGSERKDYTPLIVTLGFFTVLYLLVIKEK
jgi:hypothetical protein